MNDTQSAPAPPALRRLRPELVFSLLSLAASMGAVAITGVQTRMMQRQQEASVWPYVEMDTTISGNGYSFTITNKGVGPAIVKSLTYTYKGKTYTDIQELSRTIINDPDFGWDSYSVSNTDKRVLAINEKIPVFGVGITEKDRKNKTKAEAYAAKLIAEAKNVRATLEYESVYGARWTNTNNEVVKTR
jgi:hypothetical protein